MGFLKPSKSPFLKFVYKKDYTINKHGIKMTQYKVTFTNMQDFTSAYDLTSGSVTNSSYLKHKNGDNINEYR
jgi:hypothetical protein